VPRITVALSISNPKAAPAQSRSMPANLTPNLFPNWKGTRLFFSFSLGAGVTPAEGSVKPTEGFTLDQVSLAEDAPFSL
jgi:hypothetical protein